LIFLLLQCHREDIFLEWYLKIISDDSGIEPQELFEYFKNQYGDPTFVEEVDFGNYRLSSKLYSTKMMGQFTEKIVAWGREKGPNHS
jgi:hypothetical protein